ncbi:hypothetical protein M662_17375 [Bacillus sp. SB49]|uniref:hypothetical protein n=1 Tax=Bacillaceae TaxID=186817 RepID=UPI00047BE80B|nr:MULTISPECIES: hypothetical protein [Bacillaceae]QHT48175.1 hypothetical protein M662_17375 [Bacillus sp. SB49]
MRHQSSSILVKANLLEECMNAFKYAAEVVEKGSHMKDELCLSCAEVCRTSAEECLLLTGSKEDPVYRMCLEYADLCEGLRQYVTEPKRRTGMRRSG